MIQIKAVLAVAMVTVVVMLQSTSAIPFNRPYAPQGVRLTVHPPVSGADIQIARGNAIHPFVNPGIVPVDGYIISDSEYYGGGIHGGIGGPVVAYHNDIGPRYVKYDKPDLDYVHYGHPAGDVY
ncbi:unnamed protein product [Lymnaea stagnalis]|uniref:Uncharacterized protein n=1 Tax=Lymnaea stagnalis TaxID=6523 RepID=A0AAV2H893_LYMST